MRDKGGFGSISLKSEYENINVDSVQNIEIYRNSYIPSDLAVIFI